MHSENNYAERIMELLNCSEKASALNIEFLQYLSQTSLRLENPVQTIRAIRQFLNDKKKRVVDLFGPKTGKYGSTCMEMSLATALLADINNVDARLVFVINHTVIPIHYNILVESNGKQIEMGVMFRKRKPEELKVRYRKELTPEGAVKHARYLGIPLKTIGWRRLVSLGKKISKERLAVVQFAAAPVR